MNEPVKKSLTHSQREVLDLMRQGLINRDIATALNISDRTVSTVIRRAYKKYDVEPHMNAYFFINALIEKGVFNTEEDGE